jgi:hypothetical protein
MSSTTLFLTLCRRLLLALAAVCCLSFTPRAHAQWHSEAYTLKGGWNAVWLPLDVSHASIEELIPATVSEVWRWNALEAGTFTEVPAGAPSQTEAQWSVWRRVDPAGSNLSQLTGNFAYLIRVESGTPTSVWTVRGIPMPPRYDWSRTGVNLVGFPIQTPASSTTEPPPSHADR